MDSNGIRAALSDVPAPDGKVSIVTAGIVGDIEFEGGAVRVVLRFGEITREARHAIEDRVHDVVEKMEGVTDVTLSVEVEEADTAGGEPAPEHGDGEAGDKNQARMRPSVPPSLAQVKNVIAVASGKGGVGKSTVAVNLALAMQHRGAKVGLLDIDVYGPSAPILLGAKGAVPGVSADKKRFVPAEAYGLRVMSLGFMVTDDTPVIWRGPIVNSVVKQFIEDVVWGSLDYLVVDLPPGTGDAQLTLSQTTPLSGVVIVTTPSELALVDALKGLQMFRQVEMPVTGIVENMSFYACPSCGHESAPFNTGGTERIVVEFDVKLLGRVPIDIDIQRGGDTGRPVTVDKPDSSQAKAFLDIADEVIGAHPFEGVEPGKF